MLGLGTLNKIRKGGFGIDEVEELLEVAGLTQVRVRSLADEAKPEAFKLAAQSSIREGAQVAMIEGRAKDGTVLRGIFILSPPEKALDTSNCSDRMNSTFSSTCASLPS